MVVPDAVEAACGWRAWRIVDSPGGFRLVSVARDACWPPGAPLEAGCDQPGGHEAPDPRCRCGVYAARRPDLAVDWLPPYVQATSRIIAPAVLGYDAVVAVGLVSLWGRTVECEWGWRAQLAYPRALFVPAAVKHYRRRAGSLEIFDSDSLAVSLAGLYRVPVEVAWSLRAAALVRLARAA